jgi:hypothetical protein
VKKEKGIIRNEGMGGFLNPPTHPEHYFSVESSLERSPPNRDVCSLSYCAYRAKYFDNDIRTEAKKLLEEWKPLPISNSLLVQEWILQVLGYFRSCYLSKNGNKNADALIIKPRWNPLKHLKRHRGVDFIREFYPDFIPTSEQFDQACWGKKA